MNKLSQLPDFDEYGILPPGVYNVKIDEMVKRFGGSKSLKRSKLTKNLKLFYNFVRYYTIALYINGSYVTSTLSPSDIDILLIFPSEFKKNIAAWLRYLEFSNHSNYNLHIYGFFEGENEEDKKYFFNWFTHVRPEEGGQEKGIILLETK